MEILLLRSPDGNFMYQCSTCPTKPTYHSGPLLEEHMAVHHFKFSPFECQDCNKLYGTEEAIVNHCRLIHGRERFSFKFHYTPGAFTTRDQIKNQAKRAAEMLHMQHAITHQPQLMFPGLPPTDPSKNCLPPTNQHMRIAPSSSPPPTPTEMVLDNEDPNFDNALVIAEEEPSITSQEEFSQKFIKEEIVDSEDGDQPAAALGKLADLLAPSLPSPVTPDMSFGMLPIMRMPPPSTLGNVNLAEFEPDSMVRKNEAIFAEMIRRSELFASKALDLNSKRIACLKCGACVADQRSSRFYHANTKHIKLPLYECKGCLKKWCTISRSDVVKHINACHGGDESLIIDHKPRVRQQLRVLVEMCFPKKVRGSRSKPNNVSTTAPQLMLAQFLNEAAVSENGEEGSLSGYPTAQLYQMTNIKEELEDGHLMEEDEEEDEDEDDELEDDELLSNKNPPLPTSNLDI